MDFGLRENLRADEMLVAFVELEMAIYKCALGVGRGRGVGVHLPVHGVGVGVGVAVAVGVGVGVGGPPVGVTTRLSTIKIGP